MRPEVAVARRARTVVIDDPGYCSPRSPDAHRPGCRNNNSLRRQEITELAASAPGAAAHTPPRVAVGRTMMINFPGVQARPSDCPRWPFASRTILRRDELAGALVVLNPQNRHAADCERRNQTICRAAALIISSDDAAGSIKRASAARSGSRNRDSRRPKPRCRTRARRTACRPRSDGRPGLPSCNARCPSRP